MTATRKPTANTLLAIGTKRDRTSIPGFWRAALLLLCLLLVPAADGMAAKHALLVGVGAYPHLAPSKQLEGPAHDVAALAELLRTRHEFPASHIVTLVDKAATRSAVLRELERLADRVGAGDLVMIYFSGHGTSSHEYEAWGFSAHTGALLPFDFKMDKNVEKMKACLIIGRRDIRPILERLDRKSPRVLAVFDACYSGYTIRSCRKTAARSRYVALPLKDLIGEEKPGRHGTETARKPDYPYRNVVYMSAASSEEQAWDITRGLIWNGQKTYDNRPHGAMTDALLHGMAGAADTNGDEEMTFNELYHFVKGRVTKGFAQTPQLLHAEKNPDLLDTPLFRLSKQQKTIKPLRPAAGGPVKVRLERIPGGIKSAVEQLSGVTIVTSDDYDLLITPRKMVKRDIRRFVHLYLANGRLLDSVPLKTVVERVRRHTRVERLIGHTYPETDFNLFLELIGDPGVLLEDDPVGFTIRSEADAYILLLNIDPTGGINVLYPFMPEDLRPVRAGSPLELPELGYVSPPHFGIEHIKAFAFKDRPPGLAKFLGESFPPDSPLFEDLMALIDTRAGAAQATLAVQTAPRSEVVLADGEGAD